MVARSYEEAQAEVAVEYTERYFDELEAALWSMARLIAQPGGEVHLPTYQKIKQHYDETAERMAIIAEARHRAARPRPKGVRKRSSRACRDVA